MKMKQTLIALAVASAFAAPVAMAGDAPAGPSNTSIYGAMNASIDMVTSDGAAGAGDVTNNHVASNESRLGVKGSEDLGGGLSAIFQIESGVELDNDAAGLHGSTTTGARGGTTIGERNTFVGLSSGDMGTVVLGRHDTPYKISTRKLDQFAYTIADNRSIMGNNTHDDRIGNVAAYISPSFGGLSVAVATVFGSERGRIALTEDEKSTTYSLAGMYSMGGIYGTVAYQTIEFGQADGTVSGGQATLVANLPKLTATKIGGSYSMDAFTVGAVYEMLSNETGTNEAKNNNIYLSGAFNLSSMSKVKAAYTMRGETENNGVVAPNTEATQMSIGYDHGLSARTKLYALYSSLSNDGVGTGIKLSGKGTSSSAPRAVDATVFSVGVMHSF